MFNTRFIFIFGTCYPTFIICKSFMPGCENSSWIKSNLFSGYNFSWEQKLVYENALVQPIVDVCICWVLELIWLPCGSILKSTGLLRADLWTTWSSYNGWNVTVILLMVALWMSMLLALCSFLSFNQLWLLLFFIRNFVRILN